MSRVQRNKCKFCQAYIKSTGRNSETEVCRNCARSRQEADR